MNPTNFNPNPEQAPPNQPEPTTFQPNPAAPDSPISPTPVPANYQNINTQISTPNQYTNPVTTSPNVADNMPTYSPLSQMPTVNNQVETAYQSTLQPNSYAATAVPNPGNIPQLPNQPQTNFVSQAPKAAENNFSHKKLALVLGILLLLIVASLGVGISQINKRHKISTHSYNSTSASSNLVSYTSTAGNYTAAFPGKPTIEPPSTQSEDGTSFTENIAEYSKGETAYLVTYFTYPSTVKLSDSATSLNQIIQSEANQIQNGKLVSSSPTSLNGNYAEKYEVSGDKNNITYYLSGEVTVSGQVLYNILFSSEDGAQTSTAQQFINSFKLGQ